MTARSWTFWRSWSIGLRMAFITMLPVVFLFTAFVWYSWYAHRAQVAEELAERGRILARALAETSEYNVISGNLTDLRLTINGLVQSDKSIFRVDVVDAAGKRAVRVTSDSAQDAEPHYYEAPIRKQVVWINLFSDNGTPHVSASSDARPPTLTTEIVGSVRVTMSPANMLAKQTRRFQVEVAIAALALVASGVLAWVLARSLTQPLKEAIDALRAIRGGQYRIELPVTTGGEVGELQESIGEMSVALERSTQDLENKVAARTRDLVASRNEALRADADKRKLIQKVNSIIEDERKSIAIEIHDELNASLIAVRLEAQSIGMLASKAPPAPEVDEIRAKAGAITKLALDLYANGRRLVRRLRPEVLDMLGLHGAVEEMLRHYDSGSGCRFAFHSDGDFSRLGNELAISAYRIVQEALSNVMKHAGATAAEVTLVLDAPRDTLRIEVEDNGHGFDPAHNSEGIGIIGMRERVYALHGTIEVRSAPERGTTVTIALPLSPPPPLPAPLPPPLPPAGASAVS
ncbi:HAMP domain-containing sensor histidine kinase [Massilia sp. Dwa41.01b]|uniref:sensor histidine kinase n=1 Tax=unclassified Massilia TaxID=2609279 RepID=UPI0016046618|nr:MULTISPECIES: ATP-binding protein [unclassified Massilia]QNA90702.1 HAMP domain-containing sensor histidine kinase [Massilia sp. Dwa41.01b]QNA97934.1 HAMP domain-containing sensor histidine kinase [Massilia sp. Se16.2.3]